jgi:hypothetical protein
MYLPTSSIVYRFVRKVNKVLCTNIKLKKISSPIRRAPASANTGYASLSRLSLVERNDPAPVARPRGGGGWGGG